MGFRTLDIHTNSYMHPENFSEYRFLETHRKTQVFPKVAQTSGNEWK